MMDYISKHKTSIKNMIYATICVVLFQVMGYSNDTSVIIGVLFLITVELLVPLKKTLDEIRDSGVKTT